jgi:hypothetical protein
MNDLKSGAPINKKRTRWTARSLIKRRNTSAAYAALKSAATITLRALTSSDTRESPRDVRTPAVSPTTVR